MTKAILKNYRQSPRKVRLIADLIRGLPVGKARMRLSVTPKRAAQPVLKVLESAVANAREAGADPELMRVETVTVDEGPTLFRTRPRAQGRAFVIRKRTSHIYIKLAETKEEISAAGEAVAVSANKSQSVK